MRKKNRKLIVLFLLVVALSAWKPPVKAKSDEQSLTATVNFQAETPVEPQTAIEITLSRALQTNERIGVLLDKTDVSSIFAGEENRLRYDAELLPLPIGETKLTVYLVKSSLWKEIARFNLSVVSAQPSAVETNNKQLTTDNAQNDFPAEKPAAASNESPAATPADKSGAVDEPRETAQAISQPTPEARPFGFEKLDFLPSLTLGLKSQPFQANFPAEARPAERAVFTDFALQASFKNEVERGRFGLNSNFDFAGSSLEAEALQFGALGEKAPQIDLASYLMQFKIGKAAVALGHTSFGSNKLLVNGFSSRGVSVNVPINKRFDLTAGFLNGTSLVGFGNFFGLKKIKHQVQGATLGIEIFPKRPNAARIEITGFNAYIQPVNSVGEGRIADPERSRGGAVRFLTSDKSERFKLEAGASLSRSFNPADTTLDPDGNAIPLPAISRSAHYIESSFQLLKGIKLTETRKINLNFAFRHELTEPLYKSLGASPQPDKVLQDYSLDGSIGDLTIAYGHTRFNDNLRNVASILKSNTRQHRFLIGVPTFSLFGKPDKPSPFLPRISYGFDRTHQFGASIPASGGFEFEPSAIPDQIGTNQTFSAAWQFKRFNFEYRYNRSFQDNRQQEREQADQLNFVHGFAIGVNPFSKLSVNVGYNLDNSHNFELNQINRTKALTVGGNWQPFKGATFGGNLSHTLAGDAAKSNSNHNTNYDFQFAYNFSFEKSKFKKIGMQAFVRYADTFARSRDFLFETNSLNKTRIVNAGLTFNFF